MIGGANKRRHIEPVEMPVGERADEILDRTGPGPVALAIGLCLDFGHPIDELQPVRAGGLTDRIDHHLAVRQPASPHHAGARQHRFPSRHAAPHVDAGIARFAFAREKLLADRGIDAVAGDGGTTAYGAAVAASRPVGKTDADTGLILFNSDAVLVGQQPVGSGARTEGIEQDHLQIAAMDGELWVLVARCPSQRLPINQLTEAIEKGRVLGRDRDPRQISFKSERGKFFGGMRKQIDADPDRLDVGRRFKYPAGDSGGVQCEPQGQSADAGPDNNDVVHVCSRRARSGDCRDETRLVRPLSIWPPRRRKPIS